MDEIQERRNLNAVVNLPLNHKFSKDYLTRFPINDNLPSPHDMMQWLKDTGYSQWVNYHGVKCILEFVHNRLTRLANRRLEIALEIANEYHDDPN